jgi:UDP-N-acetylenolpyruvoylglucosamine reductase
MKTLYNEDLSKHTSVSIGGIAETMLVPESTDELLELVRKQSPKWYMGGD